MTTQPSAETPSAALLAAQNRLLALRAHLRTTPHPATSATGDPDLGRDASTPLPAHLGWESARVTEMLRAREGRHPQPERQLPLITPSFEESVPSQTQPSAISAEIRLFPDLASAMLRQERVASGRVWLLLRHLDRHGRGHHAIADVRAALTAKTAALRLCGWRQLRNLLRQGEGIFWERDAKRLWLRSTAKVAAALGIGHLTMRPVGLPIAVLQRPIGDVRAHFYATFHSGHSGKPIARETLARTTAVAQRTQRNYEERLQLKKERNFAVGARADELTIEKAGWDHGRGAFTLVDHRGLSGQKGARYVAWQLPNSYHGPHTPHTKHARKRINRVLADLQTNGTAGNDQRVGGSAARRYVASGREAGRAKDHQAVYWPGNRRGIWYTLSD